ncbi:MAG: ABC transporter ATP-binding protein [Proteobacteria bacterium]|nr:ABC transporter ATP-binding protein [Pseudomonadota bacterium]
MARGAPLLEVSDVARAFYGLRALTGVSFGVRQGTITGLIGPNGAGKTTLFNVISGMLRADAGRVTFAGWDATNRAPHLISRAGLVRSFQIARGFPRLTVRENLMLYARDNPGERMSRALLWNAKTRQAEREIGARAAAVADRLGLRAVLDNPASALSGGQKKLLEIGRTMMASPSMILLDEPAAGVNPSLTRTIAGHVRALADEGMTVLIIEHDMTLVRELCDPVIVMTEGRTLVEGTFAAVAGDARVQEAYLGKKQWH